MVDFVYFLQIAVCSLSTGPVSRVHEANIFRASMPSSFTKVLRTSTRRQTATLIHALSKDTR